MQCILNNKNNGFRNQPKYFKTKLKGRGLKDNQKAY